MVQKRVRVERKGIERKRETEPRMGKEGGCSRLAASQGDSVEIKISIRACGWSDYSVLGSCQC